MRLPPLPPDPKPTEDDLRPFLEIVEARGIAPSEIRKGWTIEVYKKAQAWSLWYRDLRRKDKNAFCVCLPPPGYAAYLRSDPWRFDIRKRALRAFNGECACCPALATDVHHRDYRPRVMSGEDITALVALCASCHDKVHGNRKNWHSWQEQEQVLAALVEQKHDVIRLEAHSPT